MIKDLKLMNGFGFIEYGDELDARDVVPGQSNCRLPSLPLLTVYSFPYDCSLHLPGPF